MDFLEKPELGTTTTKIYLKCIGSYRSAEKRERMKKFCQAVKISAKKYDKRVPRLEFIEPTIPNEVSSKECRDELQDVYEKKFAKKPQNSSDDDDDSVGETVYSYFKKIRRSKICGRCPICGSSAGITELDHYLPKSKYPTLCVHPNNLIPICSACNDKKKAKVSTPAEGMHLHLYFDRLPMTEVEDGDPYIEAFLYAELDENFRIRFVVQCPDSWDSSFSKRLEKHMEIFELSERYEKAAYAEYAALIRKWRKHTPKQYDSSLSTDAREQLEIRALQKVIDAQLVSTCDDLNTWQSALYRALEGKEAELAAFLKAHEAEILDAALRYN